MRRVKGGLRARSAGLRLAPRIDNEREAYLPFTLALHFLCTTGTCRIMSTARRAAQALGLKEIYIGGGRHKQDALPYVQNNGRCHSGCCRREHRRQTASLAGCATDGSVATDVLSMQTGLLRAVGDAD